MKIFRIYVNLTYLCSYKYLFFATLSKFERNLTGTKPRFIHHLVKPFQLYTFTKTLLKFVPLFVFKFYRTSFF